MAALKGNQNAKGNKGGHKFNDKKLAASVRTLTLKEIEKILLGADGEYKKQLVLKLAGTILPRLTEHSGGIGVNIDDMRENYV